MSLLVLKDHSVLFAVPSVLIHVLSSSVEDGPLSCVMSCDSGDVFRNCSTYVFAGNSGLASSPQVVG